MDIQESLFSFGLMGISVVAAYFLFRKNPRESLVSRGPLFLVCFLIFFYIGFARLPLALPGLFERLLGHSVWVEFMPPARMNVTQVGGTWWLVRWFDPVRTSYFYVVLGGMVWAVFNLARRRALKSNARSLSSSAFLAGRHTSIYLSCVFLSACEKRCYGFGLISR
jgi:hypothetical protein